MFAGWLVAFCLLLNLLASSVCLAGPRAGATDSLAHYPICHSTHGAGDRTNGSDRQAPTDQQAPCPFCSLHCHSPLAASAPAADVSRAQLASFVPAPLPTVREPCGARRVDAAKPRGPPQTL